MQWIFWISLFVLLYVYLGYPATLALWRPSSKPEDPSDNGPVAFDVVIASRSEGPRLFEKIQEVCRLQGPGTLNRLLIGLDGDDPTLPDPASLSLDADFPVTLVRESDALPDPASLPDQGCIIIEFSERRSKPACLNQLMTFASSPWVVFLDVRQRLDPNCLSALANHFSTPGTHVVSGNLEWEPVASETTTQQGVGLYWAYEKWIRMNESRRGVVPGATGACYALRRSAFHSIPEDTLDDDVLIPLQACQSGGDCLFEQDAIIYDIPSATSDQEGLRKRRTIAGIYQILFRHPGWNLPGGHPFWLSILSHKTLRLAGPFLLILIFLSSLSLQCCWMYRLCLFGQIVFYIGAIAAPVLKDLPGIGKLSSAARSFVHLNWICLRALVDTVTGTFSKGWTRAYVSSPEGES